MDYTPFEEVKQHIGFLLEILSSRSYESLDARLKDFNLNPHCYYILLLAIKGNFTQKQIGEYLSLNVNTVTRLLDSLDEMHLAKRWTNPDNRKENFVQITAQGEKVVKSAMVRLIKQREEAYADLTKDERKELHRILLKLFESGGPK